MTREARLPLAHFWVSVVSFGIAAFMAVMQALSRANIDLPLRSPEMYYLSVTAHGVLMALVFTTFFIMALGYVVVSTTFGRIVWEPAAWAAFWIALSGVLMTTVAILSGTSTVLYTFYPPLQAHPAFYIGATLLVVGSWIWCAVLLLSYRAWRRTHRSDPIPLAAHGMMAAVIVWLLATAGLAVEALFMLIPWSLGLVDRVDPMAARTLFWWFGHPLTYFWLLPAYVVWYTLLPQLVGGRVFSDPLTRMVFVMFILLSTPVGFHHQFMDPGISARWKLVHSVATYAIMFPSLVTAFSVVASLELAGRAKGGTGLFGWVTRLPWRDPFFASIILAMLGFTLGGFGGAINAAYSMNAMVHNTAWMPGHFHLTVGTAVALTFMGASYWLLPRLTGRALCFRPLAIAQPYLWFAGMLTFSISTHIAGVLGMPRRVYLGTFQGSPVAASWNTLTDISAIGGVILFLSSLCYLAVLGGTMIWSEEGEAPRVEYARPFRPADGRSALWDRFGLWTAVAIALIAIAYYKPISDLLALHRFGSQAFHPF